MAGVVVKKINPKQVAIGVVATMVLMCIPKVGTMLSDALATVRTKIGGGV